MTQNRHERNASFDVYYVLFMFMLYNKSRVFVKANQQGMGKIYILVDQYKKGELVKLADVDVKLYISSINTYFYKSRKQVIIQL